MTSRITHRRSSNRKSLPNAKKKAPKAKAKRSQPLTARDLEALQFRRMAIVGGLMLSLLVSVGGFCLYLQGCESEAFVIEAERNYLRKLSLDTQRGNIYDRTGEALATSVEVDTVYANPRQVVDPVQAATLLAEALSMETEPLIRELTTYSHFRYIKRQITAEEAAKVRALDIHGVRMTREAKRFYPKKELAGQLLGVVGYDSVGVEGLERAYDHHLRGGRLEADYYRDVRGRYAMMEALPAIETSAGHSVQVTLDEKIQAMAERALERACLSARARGGVAVIMDVATGDVLAMAHWPRFNPNRYREQIAEDRAMREAGKDVVQRDRNRIVADQFEPGSTFKIFTLAAALESGVVTLNELVNLEGGRYKVGRKWISDTHRFKEMKTVAQIIKYSSNIGVIKMAQRMGKPLLHEYLSRFGFGESTQTGLPGEAKGKLRPHKQWADITQANIAFGQGIAVTPLQITAAVAAIGNGGVLMKPRLVMRVLDSEQNVVSEFPPKAMHRVVSRGTARQVVEAMKGVVEHDGTAPLAWIYDYEVAGKTGTAQKIDPIAGGYAEDRWVASFVGLAPARNPKLAVLVAVDEPKGQYYGGVVAAPAFREMTEWTLNYLGIAPSYGSRERVHKKAVMKKFGRPHVSAEGAYYDWPDGVTPGVDVQEPRQVVVPDFTQMPIRDSVKLAHERLVWVDIDGTGLAAGQSILPGTMVPPWTRVTVYFRPDDGEPAAGGTL